MIELLAILVIAYAARGPLLWIGARTIAFWSGFILGWQLMRRR